MITNGVTRWADTLTYDLRGKVTSAGAEYAGLGFVIDPGDLTWGITSNLDFETLTNNGLGQVTTREVRHAQVEGADVPDGEFDYTYRAQGGVEQIREQWTLTTGAEAAFWSPVNTATTYAVAGNATKSVRTSFAFDFNTDTTSATKLAEYRTDSRSYYSADQRLMVHQADRDTVPLFPVQSQGDTTGVNWGAYEEYWYDALGRRVLKRSYQEGLICDWSERCDSFIEHVVWDGDQILWELRQSDIGDTKNPGGTDFRGTIGYLQL